MADESNSKQHKYNNNVSTIRYCWEIQSKMFMNESCPSLSNFFLQRNSWKYVSNSFSLVDMSPSFLIILFVADRILSTPWVWAPVTGSIKFREWFTVWWSYPSWFSWLYALHSSENITVPGLMYFWMIGIRVAVSHFGTLTINEFAEPLSVPPNTQWPSADKRCGLKKGLLIKTLKSGCW